LLHRLRSGKALWGIDADGLTGKLPPFLPDASVVSKLRERLLDELKRTGDPRLVDDGKFFETPPMAGPLPDDVPKPNRQRRP
jgi:hypothetical protein